MYKYYIKNMVCNRCIAAVKNLLDINGVQNSHVALGEIETEDKIPEDKLAKLSDQLNAQGFELLNDARQKLIEQIKNIIIGRIHYGNNDETRNFSDVLSTKLHKSYSYLSGLFSDVEGITIEKYIILQKTERIKELLAYGELNLNEIAYELGYSSPAHLSNQFKKVTGLSPSHFKVIGNHKRKPLDEV